MKLYFRLALVYLGIALVVTGYYRGVGFAILAEAATSSVAISWVLAVTAVWVVPLIVAVPMVIGWQRFRAEIGAVVYAVAGSVLLQTGFSFVKSTISDIVPFYADKALAALDRWLHGGVDPWVIAHKMALWFPVDVLLPFYVQVWAFPAIALPLVIAISDRDRLRVARFMILFGACWLILGNVLAIAFSSAGPVFYDRLLGTDRFADLTAMLEHSGLATSRIGSMQAYLWNGYSKGSLAFGSGISAFPSVHLGIATVCALYMAERRRWLVLPGVIFVAIILYLSVYTGYHYAIDGYFSIVVILALHATLKRSRRFGSGGDNRARASRLPEKAR